MEVGDVCSREVYIVRPGEPLADAAREMTRRHIGAVVVVETSNGVVRPIGIVTDRDIVCGQLDRKADLASLKVGEVMTASPLTVEESGDTGQALRAMSAKAVRRAPVVNAVGELVGIVTLDDLLPVMADELTALAKLIGTQSRAER
jgi:CBS domain-containing protein